MTLGAFHPAVAGWFGSSFSGPTACQSKAWPAIRARHNVLIAAPTGSGKTLAAFLAAIDRLVREGVAHGGLPDQTRVLYVSPLKALSNDVHRNLEDPLAGIARSLAASGQPDPGIRTWVRTGDTPAGERERMRRRPPHIVVTTPESLYLLLTAESGRQMLATVDTVIVDEIHALAGSKRGAHLALSLERLAALTATPPLRIGLSATQKPIETVAQFLVGAAGGDCLIIDTGHMRARDLALELPRSALEAVMSGEVWGEIYDRLAELADGHRTTLVFVNTRRLAERAARHLAERLGEGAVATHHGSLSREQRLAAEQRLKSGTLRVLVATASLELGIDIGAVDLVCQIGSPRAISTLLQRVGRSGHQVDGTPRGRLFPLSRDDLVECAALLEAVERGELDRLQVPRAPLDVLAQQIVAEVASREWDEAALYDCLRRAWPYRALDRDTFLAVVRMLAEGFATRRGRRSAWLHRDAVHGRLRARRGARLTALTNGGAIPDQFDYQVMLEPEGIQVGTLNEDFAFESLPGDIFQLGNTSYRILQVAGGTVRVEDARGQPPNIPFWFGEAPGRTDELSRAVSLLREQVAGALETGRDATAALAALPGVGEAAAEQIHEYLAAAHAALGTLPCQREIVLERFFDETGDMHLVLHSPFGSRLNRAWGLALRKRFCRQFNFELQAAALEDSLVLSLGPTHSFPLEEVGRYLNAATVREVLIQALLDAPMFGTRWRWAATIALAVRRTAGGRRRPAQFQRTDAEDLLAVVFPDQLACAENLAGVREVPDHPLVHQVIDDCLYEVMDVEGLERVLRQLADGMIRFRTVDLTSPSPLACEILTARPYAFLDDAPAEERRTLAVQTRARVSVAEAARFGTLDAAAIARVRAEAWPEATTSDELHDALLVTGWLAPDHDALAAGWCELFDALLRTGRATVAETASGARLWVAAERVPMVAAALPECSFRPAVCVPAEFTGQPWEQEEAFTELVRGRLGAGGPLTVAALADAGRFPAAAVGSALTRLEAEGSAVRGRFTGTGEEEWCERGLLARIHRYTLDRLRSEIEPVGAADFMRFLLHWQRAGTGHRPATGPDSLAAALAALEGFEAPAGTWETGLLRLRLEDYTGTELDALCLSGRVQWLRLAPRAGHGGTGLRSVPVAWCERGSLRHWRGLAAPDTGAIRDALSGTASRLLGAFGQYGALFFDELVETSGLLRTQVEGALAELVGAGLASADSWAGMRALLGLRDTRSGRPGRTRRGPASAGTGRWHLVREPVAPADVDGPAVRARRGEAVDHIARVLLRRYGVVCRRLLEREADWLPPWRELLPVYRRLAARGEVRGGRFVRGLAGEHFAAPEAVGLLREVRRRGPTGELVAISAADPLNLAGIITPGPRIPATGAHRILLRDGVPLAVQQGREVRFLQALDAAAEWEARTALLRRPPAGTGLLRAH